MISSAFARLENAASDGLKLRDFASTPAGKTPPLFGPQVPWERDRSLSAAFHAQAARTPSAMAVQDGARELSYAALEALAATLASDLQTACITRGTPVAVLYGRSVEFVVAVLGILKAGGCYVPLDATQPRARLAHAVADTGARLALAPAAQAELVAQLGLTSLPAPATPCAEVRCTAAVGAQDLAYILFTSGSSGRPKGVAITQESVFAMVAASQAFGFTSADRVAFAANPAFDASTFEIWNALLTGACLVVVAKNVLVNARHTAESLRSLGITMALLTTPVFHKVVHFTPAGFGFLRCLFVGGDALLSAAAHEVLASGSPPARLINLYGPTEGTVFACAYELSALPATAGWVPLGKPVANFVVTVCEASGEPVPLGEAGEAGELCLAGPSVAQGYVAQPALTAAAFVERAGVRTYRTGDLVRLLPEGNLEFCGRMDDQAKIRGHRVEPSEVEGVLLQHPGVQQCRVRLGEVEPLGRQLLAYVVLKPGVELPTEALFTHLRERLPEYLVPFAITPLESLPLTTSGKVDLAALPLPPAPAGEPLRASRATAEGQVSRAWATVLGRPPASLEENFFFAGGDSLLAVSFLHALREGCGAEIPVRQLFETPTVRGLADYLLQSLPAHTVESGPLLAIQQGAAQLTPLFVVPGGWGAELELLKFVPLARLISPQLSLYGFRAQHHEAHTTVEAMATRYLEALRQRQRHGPYLLCGECVGATVAYEMARQLQAQGETLSLLVLLDADMPDDISAAERIRADRRRRFWQREIRQRVRHHWAQLAPLSWPARGAYVRARLARLRQWWREHRPAAPSPALVPELAPDDAQLERYLEVLRAHQVQPYAGLLTLVFSAEAHAQGGAEKVQALHGGVVESFIVPGSHHTYLHEQAFSTAAQLRLLLERASPPFHSLMQSPLGTERVSTHE